ncbi:MAG TPA: hypothetical protein VGL55_02430 [Steroidobacteraceae bacterium]|jgi:hypothetical protein
MELQPVTRPASAGDLIKSRAERMAEEEREREQKRSQELAEQRSDLNPPGARIRAWERMHGLNMPSDPEHPVLDVIAVSTRLTLAEVQQEQRLRAERLAGTVRDDR